MPASAPVEKRATRSSPWRPRLSLTTQLFGDPRGDTYEPKDDRYCRTRGPVGKCSIRVSGPIL